MARRIDDHSFFAGKGSKSSPLPEGCHSKYMESGEGSGDLKVYQDTAGQVEALQDKNVSKMKAGDQPSINRN